MSDHIEILKKYNIWAKKSLGQNFLVDEPKVQEIADYCELEEKNIVEVGPGYGALTKKLVEKSPESLTLIELDRDMISVLEDRGFSNDADIKNIDVLEYAPDFAKYSVIANIPYYITSPILRHFLYEVEKKPEEMLILMQQNVGDKILGKGKNKSSVLSLFIQKKCRVKEVLLVPKESFHPVPKVESSVLYFETHDDYQNIDDKKFLKIIKSGFGSPRKKLIKNFVNAELDKQHVLDIFEQLNIEQGIRGEDLDIGKWCELVERI
ncbi:16S rRNA (adenine(1518)-N(6)/adenine(1519)-N(6))-dimethyltransferase RsmA [Candidatus Gracilibacteria bacterium]|nr:16S rRNA (adenine(1518)-N(6)/adenine(1519)-N(6))-dimethyltransferase RsmA [Candidatus Gracilibacteria bacterium]